MKAGDIIRFKLQPIAGPLEGRPWNIGLLVEYHKWEKIATILYDEEIYRVRAEDVQLYARGEYVKGR